jgi:hypothetical protein
MTHWRYKLQQKHSKNLEKNNDMHRKHLGYFILTVYPDKENLFTELLTNYLQTT